MSSFSLCTTGNKNVGGIKCDVSRGVLRQPFIFNDEFDAADVADSDTFLNKLVENAGLGKNTSGKVFPLPTVEEITDKSEANKEGSLALGFKQVLFEGRPAWEAKFFAGNVQMKSLRKFNNKTVGVLEYDANGNMWGTVSSGKFKGFAAKVFFAGGKLATGNAVEEGIVTITVSILDVNEYFDNAYFMPIEGNITDVEGLVDVEMYEFAAHVSNAYKIGIRLATSQVNKYLNMYDNYGDELADGALFLAYTGADFLTPLTITSVAKDTTNKVFTFTFDSTMHTALAANAKIKIVAVAPPDLADADITGIEIDSVIVVKTP
jgi:hypothetical protein